MDLVDIMAALKEVYLDPIKERPQLFIGVELELPIVNLTGQATDLEISQSLLRHLTQELDMTVEAYDAQGNPVQLWDPVTDDRILFEVSYNILELAFGKAESIQEIACRFEQYLQLAQAFLAPHQHALQGCGIHPNWDKNDNRPVALPRYQMLMAYLALGKEQAEGVCHPFYDYGAYICGNQVQLDVSKSNYRRVLNAFNQIEAAKAYLFANSHFTGTDWETRIARDHLWERSMHGLIASNVGLYSQEFQTDDDFLYHLTQTAMFTVSRDGQIYYFQPLTVQDYFHQQEVLAESWNAASRLLLPQLSDLASHRAYHYQSLTKRGTVEFRSVCAQPLAQTFAPTAFHLGLVVAMAELETFLATSPFFDRYGRDYPALRKRFSHPNLSPSEEQDIQAFSLTLVQLAEQGLKQRGRKEEAYLAPMKARLK